LPKIGDARNSNAFHFACLLTGVLCTLCLWAAPVNAAGPNERQGGVAQRSVSNSWSMASSWEHWALSPTNATGFGYHVHRGASLDDLLDDFSPRGLSRPSGGGLLHDIEARIARLDTASLDAEQRADIDIMHDASRRFAIGTR